MGIYANYPIALASGMGLNAYFTYAHQSEPETLVTLGDLKSPTVVPAVLGFLAMVALDARKVPGAVIIGILAVSFIGIALGLNKFGGFVSWPPSIAPVFLKLDVAKVLEIGLIAIVFTFFFVDVFDNTGTSAALRIRRAWLARTAGYRG
jgi:AGZA family xanthine/uracil permease-like MFS transporter